MTQSGMSWTRCEMRMVRSAGVQEPQRPFWLRTQRTLTGRDAFGTPAALLTGVEALQHPVDPLALLGPRELRRDEHHDPLAVAVRGHGPPAALAAPHLNNWLTAHAGPPSATSAR